MRVKEREKERKYVQRPKFKHRYTDTDFQTPMGVLKVRMGKNRKSKAIYSLFGLKMKVVIGSFFFL